MSSGVNKVIWVGNLCKDVEVRYVQSGKAVATLRLAASERRKDGDGWKDHAEYMDVVLWDKEAENAGKYLAKGRQVYVEGRLQTRQYKDKEGHDRYKTEIVAHQVIYLGGGDGERKSSGSGGGSSNKPAKTPDATGSTGPGFIDDDLPFLAEATGVEP